MTAQAHFKGAIWLDQPSILLRAFVSIIHTLFQNPKEWPFSRKPVRWALPLREIIVASGRKMHLEGSE